MCTLICVITFDLGKRCHAAFVQFVCSVLKIQAQFRQNYFLFPATSSSVSSAARSLSRKDECLQEEDFFGVEDQVTPIAIEGRRHAGGKRGLRLHQGRIQEADPVRDPTPVQAADETRAARTQSKTEKLITYSAKFDLVFLFAKLSHSLFFHNKI